MAERYHLSYGPHTVYEHVIRLVEHERARDGEVVVDIGCGFGPIAEPLREHGFAYCGLDAADDGLKDLIERGFEVASVDLTDVEQLTETLHGVIGDRALAAITALDVLEHLVNPEEVLQTLYQVARTHGNAPLVLSVPNVTHFDLAAKLLVGRWEITPTGLLDATHVSLFSPHRLASMTRSAGWAEIAANDFDMVTSDQHYPEDMAALALSTPLHALLFRLRQQATEGATTVNFVRAYVPASLVLPAGDCAPEAFLSVLVRTQGKRMFTLQETLLSLAAQTCQDFEVLLLVHDVPREQMGRFHALVGLFDIPFHTRVRIISVDGGGRARPLNVGVQAARGRYVAILDDDDVAFGHWVESFRDEATRSPGHILRAMVAAQQVEPVESDGQMTYMVTGAPCSPWPADFDLLAHVVDNFTPICACAFPRSVFVDMGVRYDDALPVLEDWDVLIQAAAWCGVSDLGEITSLYRGWKRHHSSRHVHPEEAWGRARDMVWARLDLMPMLLPAQSVGRVRSLFKESDRLRHEYDHVRGERDEEARRARAAEDQYDHVRGERDEETRRARAAEDHLREIEQSTSWQVTKPVRLAGRLARRFPRRRC